MTLTDLLLRHARVQPERLACVMLGEDNREEATLTFHQLHHAATVVAGRLQRHAAAGDRVLLMYSSSLEFVVVFFACQYAGLIPVPVVPPTGHRVRDVVARIISDCTPAVAATAPEHLAQVEAFLAAQGATGGLRAMAPQLDEILGAATPPVLSGATERASDVAFIQYTSGSTSDPRGVVVGQEALFANLAMMARAFENTSASTHVGWAPLHHDMGLIANLLQPLYVGALCVLMSPRRFALEPWLWLRAISHYRAEVSGGPNLAYELCVRRAARALSSPLDLSCWRLAFNSAEPVQAATLERFTAAFEVAGFQMRSFYPCYGLADATLLVTGGAVAEAPVIKTFSRVALEAGRAQPAEEGDGKTLVGAGKALTGQRVVIVDPNTGSECAAGHVGEVWVCGPNVPEGYWRDKKDRSAATFRNALASHPGENFLRTGDLGFLVDSELFITGRLKDMFIVRGRNIYPQDIEAAAQRQISGLRAGSGASFCIEREGGPFVVLVQEVERTARRHDPVQVAGAIRRAVFSELDLTLDDIVLVDPGQVPLTTSGKLRRRRAAECYARGDFARPAGVRRER